MAADEDRTTQVAVVTGGAIGIGAAIAESLARTGAYVVTMDPVVTLDGSPQEAGAEPTTADRIVAAGGRARASSTSVTDEPAVRALFADLADEFGVLDVVVNVAGISRPTGFAHGTEEDWAGVLDVHLNGYLTVLRAALPLMAAAGHGRILGVTSGSGWRAADAGAYSCAKRAVAALTWRVGQVAPAGVSINALSPIAATRMVTNALSRQAGSGGGDRSGRSAASGGVALGAAPPPEHLGPIGAYLASEDFAWSRGRIAFSNGAEVSVVAPPHLLEVVQTDTSSVAAVLDAVVPTAFVAAETAQVSTGGSVPRFGAAFADAASTDSTSSSSTAGPRCAVVTDDPEWGAALAGALGARGAECVTVDPDASDFAGAADRLDAVAADGPLDAVVVALVGPGALGGVAATAITDWQRVLDEHAGIADAIRRDASWVRAASDGSAAAQRPVRVVTITAATAAGGHSRAMAAAQLARAAAGATEQRVTAFAVAVESPSARARSTTAALAARLVHGDDVAALAGAELVVTDEWCGLRSHPTIRGTVTYGGPEVPAWVDGALRRIAAAELA